MALKNGLLITILIMTSILACNSGPKNISSNSRDSLTAGTAVNGTSDILNYLARSKEHEIFFSLVKKTSLDETLNKPGPFTIFAPTDKAFRKLPAGTLDSWQENSDGELLNFLGDHIVAGALETEDISKLKKLTTLAGDGLKVSSKNDNLLINDKSIPGGSFTCTNGIVYIIDEILVGPRKGF